MIEKTVFENLEEIINFVKEIYGIKITNVKKIDKGSANIYSLNNDKYILKEFQSKYTQKEIKKEIVVINHLKKKGIQVPTYVKTLNEEYSCVYKGKIMIIQEFIAGETLNNNDGTYEQTMECAEIYGKIVLALEDLPMKLPSSDISTWYSQESFETSIKKHKELISMLDDTNETDAKIKNDIEEKLKMINVIKDTLDFYEMNNMTIKNTHGDYNLLQFIYKNGKVAAVIDFVSACQMPIVWELIRSYSYIDSEAKNGKFNLDNFTKYVKTFNKFVKLNKYDLKYMSYIYLIQILNSTFGYKQYIYDHSKIDLLKFGCLRTNICRYLFNNAQVISNKLDSEL